MRRTRTFTNAGAGLLVALLAASSALAQAPAARPAYHATQWTRGEAAPVPAPAPPAAAPPIAEAPAEPSGVIRVQFVTQQDVDRSRGLDLTRLPGPERLFRLESEADLRERIRQDALNAGRQPPAFPAAPNPASAEAPDPPPPPTVAFVEPAYVCHGRLMFEQINSERYGWDMGGIQALALASDFYLKVLTAPGRRLIDLCRCYDTDAGLCLPGDPVPYVIRLSSR